MSFNGVFGVTAFCNSSLERTIMKKTTSSIVKINNENASGYLITSSVFVVKIGKTWVSHCAICGIKIKDHLRLRVVATDLDAMSNNNKEILEKHFKSHTTQPIPEKKEISVNEFITIKMADGFDCLACLKRIQKTAMNLEAKMFCTKPAPKPYYDSLVNEPIIQSIIKKGKRKGKIDNLRYSLIGGVVRTFEFGVGLDKYKLNRGNAGANTLHQDINCEYVMDGIDADESNDDRFEIDPTDIIKYETEEIYFLEEVINRRYVPQYLEDMHKLLGLFIRTTPKTGGINPVEKLFKYLKVVNNKYPVSTVLIEQYKAVLKTNKKVKEITEDTEEESLGYMDKIYNAGQNAADGEDYCAMPSCEGISSKDNTTRTTDDMSFWGCINPDSPSNRNMTGIMHVLVHYGRDEAIKRIKAYQAKGKLSDDNREWLLEMIVGYDNRECIRYSTPHYIKHIYTLDHWEMSPKYWATRFNAKSYVPQKAVVANGIYVKDIVPIKHLDSTVESSITKSNIKHNYDTWVGKLKYDCNVVVALPTPRLKEGHILVKVSKDGVVVAKFAARTGDVNTVVTKLKTKLDSYCNMTYVNVNPNLELYSSSWNNGLAELQTLKVKELVI